MLQTPRRFVASSVEHVAVRNAVTGEYLVVLEPLDTGSKSRDLGLHLGEAHMTSSWSRRHAR
jgi:hypothetical protein